MPNWCSNYITISGDKKKIRLITNVIKEAQSKPEDVYLFRTLIGLSEDVSDVDYETGAWYEHNINRYGTKWDLGVKEIDFSFDETSITFNCETAWSPPSNFVINLCKTYGVTGELFYSEPGSDFCGKTWVDEEGYVDEEDYNYNEGLYVLDNESFWYEIESNIEYGIENEETADEFLETYHYVSDEDKEEIRKMYNQKLEEQKNEEVSNGSN
jgi:hypothetical protein